MFARHGRKRSDAPRSAEQAAAAQKKAAAYRALSRLAFQQSASAAADGAAAAAARIAEGHADLSAQLLSLNPELYSLWNFRRRALRVAVAGVGAGAGAGAGAGDVEPAVQPAALPASAQPALLARELAVTEAAIARNPKSYHAWHHRQWSVSAFGGEAAFDASGELALCGKLLALDERNFHCWNYRRWVARFPAAAAAAAGESMLSAGGNSVAAESSDFIADSSAPSTASSAPSPEAAVVESELAYTLACIRRNFSNYSAWHERASLLSRRAAPAPVPLAELASELELVRQAAFTEPDDQSPWFYRRWAVAEVCRHAGGAAGAEARALLEEDCAHLWSLSAAEPRCRWPLSALVHTQVEFARSAPAGGGAAALWGEAAGPDAATLLVRLRELDPLRARYYAHLSR